MAFVAPTASRANIAVVLASFLIVPHRRVAITLSITIKLPSRRPSSSITVALAVHRRCAHASIAVHCHPPSIAVDEPYIVAHCRQSVHCCPPVAVTPSIAVESNRRLSITDVLSTYYLTYSNISLPSLYSLLTDLLKNNYSSAASASNLSACRLLFLP